jgi:RHS repeat-associated protein
VAKDASGTVLEDRSWVYDGQLRVIAELNARGALRARYLYASSGHSPDLAVTFDPDSGVVTGSYLLVHDQVGSVVRTVDLATGVAVESVAYDPWGVATVSPGGTSVQPFGFAGGLWDRRTGLVRFGAREYDAGIGRWLARDPIGFAGGWNHYGYAGGDPVGQLDPDGLNPVLAGWGLVLAQAAATGAAVDTAWQLGEMAFGGRDWGDFDWGRVGVAAGFGAVTGGLMRWFIPPAPAMVCPPPVDVKLANIANHIFGPKSLAKHNLDEFLGQYGGDPIAATLALQSAAQKLADAGMISAVFNATVVVGGHAVNVKGNVIGGVVNLSTAYVK